MKRRVDTQTKRIREMNTILDRLNENDETNKMMQTQASSLCKNFISTEGDDFDIRNDAIDCANQIHSSLKELQSLDASYKLSNKGSEAYKWIKLEEYNILDYVPDCITEIKGNNGEIYNNKIIDFYACFAPLKKWSEPKIDKDGNYIKRGMNLQSNNNFSHPDAQAVKKNEEPKRKRAKIQLQMNDLKNQMQHYQDLIDHDKLGFFKKHYMDILSDLEEKYRDLEHKKNSIKLEPEVKVGYYYDDPYLIQRNIRKVHGEPLRIITGTSTHKGKWGKIETENTYETITKEVVEEEWETSPEPLMPSPLDFKDFIAKDDYSNKSCLIKNLKSLKEIKRLNDAVEEVPEYYNNFLFSENDLKNDKEIIINDENLTFDYVMAIYKDLPEYLYFEQDDKSFMLAKIINKEIITTDPTIKVEYEPKYSRAEDIVKYFVYDKNIFSRYYKDNKYKLKITLKIDFSNLTNKDLKSYPKNKIGDDAYINVCKKYKGLIAENIKKSWDIYEASPAANRCEDFEPHERYEEFYRFLSTLPLPNNTQCNVFIDYCLNTIYKWVNKRIPMLVNTTTDEENAKRMLTLLLKRIRKNTGTLLIWYQSLIQFDDTYINNLLTKQLIKDSSKYMLVTRGYDGNNDKLFNKQLYPDYIDIQEVNEIYGNKKFNVGNKIYIAKNMKEQQNYITAIETIYIEEADLNNPLNNTIKVPVTRLHLRNKLLKWCNTNKPSEVMISKLL